jgi:Protein of unknown function (DUF3300)
VSKVDIDPTRPGAARIRAAAVAGYLSWLMLSAPLGAQNPAELTTPAYTRMQLDQMVAPIALYPDALLGQILMASSYPQDVVQADRWLQNPANASLNGPELAQILQKEAWDASVKSLVPFPQILSMMDNNLDWTEQLGDAFLAQQNDVMDAVQQLRSRAQSAGTLVSTPQETVTDDGQDIQVNPADPATVDVPVYDPDAAYGDWPYPDYPPDGFYIAGYPVGSFINVGVVAPLWGWDHWDWRHHQLVISGGPGARGSAVPRGQFAAWHFDPAHRGGVPYGNAANRARFEGSTDIHAVNGGFRGYTAVPAAPAPAPDEQPNFSRADTASRENAGTEYTNLRRDAPPAYESFGRGSDVHEQEQRGASSRASVHSSGGRVR